MTNWPVKTLGEVCDLVGGGTPSKDRQDFYDGDIPWATVRDLNVEVLRSTEYSITEEAVKLSASNVIPAGSVVIATRVGLGKVVKIAQDTAINQDLRGLVVKNPDELLADYLYWWYLSAAHLVVAAGTGATVQGVKLPFVSGLVIPVPPLEEQKRIVALLDDTTACITEMTFCYGQARTHADNLFSSALRDALESNPNWPVKTLGDFFRVCSSKRVLKSDWKEVGVPFYRGREISALSRDGRVNNTLFISEDLFNALADAHGVPKSGDIMITAIGTIGNSYVVKVSDRFYFKDASVLWLDKQSEINSRFVQFWIQSSSFTKQMQIGNGATVDTLTISKLSGLKVPVPPLDEQKRIVARLDQMRAKTSEMVAAYDAKLQAAKNLRQSILEAAFAGEL